MDEGLDCFNVQCWEEPSVESGKWKLGDCRGWSGCTWRRWNGVRVGNCIGFVLSASFRAFSVAGL
jgi:hypothetical protein